MTRGSSFDIYSSMKQTIENIAYIELPGILAGFLEGTEEEVSMTSLTGKNKKPDFVAKACGYEFLIECKRDAGRAALNMARQQILEFATDYSGKAIPLITVPFMGDSGKNYCESYKLSWVDLSGNAHIKAPGLLIHVEGKPNLYKKTGRPENVFSPKSARIVRQLLIAPEKSYKQRELSQTADLGEGYTSKIVRKLNKLGFIKRDNNGYIKPKDPRQFLDAWFEVYDFSKHQIIKGHIATRSGEDTLKKISAVLRDNQKDFAVTGLAAAWLINQFAKFRLTTFYLSEPPGKDLLESLGFRSDDRGANTWLVVPNDNGVFQGSSNQNGINCVHPVQVYLDLKEQPERSKEASEILMKERLNWRVNG